MVFPGGGTGKDSGAGVIADSDVALWLHRQRSWAQGFEQIISAKAREYWHLYRNFDQDPPPGPGQEWRDRTVIPTPFRIIETRVPRIILGLFGRRDWLAVEGRERSDEQWETMVSELMTAELEQIGYDSPDPDSMVLRAIDGHRYREIMGHVWWRMWWRTNRLHIKTKVPIVNPETGERKSWQEVEQEEITYDGLDLNMIPLDSLAINLLGPRQWAIEKIDTTLEALIEENDRHHAATGEDLYTDLGLLERQISAGSTPEHEKDSFEEPRDTEFWPLQDDTSSNGTTLGETPVRLWLCWDNRKRTLTKLVNGSIKIAYGLAPTPDGLDPYFGNKAVPVPKRVYGDSVLNWTASLNRSQTSIARSRMDEVKLNIWQQFLVRNGAIRDDQFFWTPGGHLLLDMDPEESLDNVMKRVDRRPVFQESYTEEANRERQADFAAGTDALSQGLEATNKSRDVAATEVQQRVLQGDIRRQLESLYHEVAFKRPLAKKAYGYLRQNLTRQKMVRVLGKDVPVDLTSLDQPIDLKIGGGIFELSRADRQSEVEGWLKLGQSPAYAPYIKAQQVLFDYAKLQGRKDPSKYIKTREEAVADSQALEGPSQGGSAARGSADMPAPAGPNMAPPDQAGAAPAESVEEI